jgi:hypothetical protein
VENREYRMMFVCGIRDEEGGGMPRSVYKVGGSLGGVVRRVAKAIQMRTCLTTV